MLQRVHLKVCPQGVPDSDSSFGFASWDPPLFWGWLGRICIDWHPVLLFSCPLIHAA